MTNHLPECFLATACKHDYYDEPPVQCANCGEECICDRLCACEQRVRAEIEADGPWFRTVVHQCCEDKQTAFDYGYAAGVAAAREAVAALLAEFPNPQFQIANAAVHTALAVIDALEKP